LNLLDIKSDGIECFLSLFKNANWNNQNKISKINVALSIQFKNQRLVVTSFI